MTEQPKPKPRPRSESRLIEAANNYELADVSAIKALHQGAASPEQQKQALDWILKKACALPDWPYVPGDPDQTNIHLGRQFVGQQIMKLLQLNLATMKRGRNSDPHEPQS